MADHGDIVTVVSDCERYWRETGVPPEAVIEMRVELQQHLIQVLAEGRPVHAVMGSDLPAFAEAWAAEQRVSTGPVASWEDAMHRRMKAESSGWLRASAMSSIREVFGTDGGSTDTPSRPTPAPE